MEASPSGALAAGERQQMPLGAEATMASTQNPAEPGAASPAGCWGLSWWQGRAEKRRERGLAGALLLSHRPAAGSPVRHQAPQSCPCLPDQHPPDPNSSREAVIGRLLLNTCNRGIVRAFVQLHLFATFRAQIKTQVLLPLTVCAPSPSVLPCPSTHSCLLVAVTEKVR